MATLRMGLSVLGQSQERRTTVGFALPIVVLCHIYEAFLRPGDLSLLTIWGKRKRLFGVLALFSLEGQERS